MKSNSHEQNKEHCRDCTHYPYCQQCEGFKPDIEDNNDQEDSSFCECGAVHGIEEIDSNRCGSCGKEVE